MGDLALTNAETLLGGALNWAFGQVGLPIMMLFVFVGTTIYLGVSWEISSLFLITLVLIMSIYGLLPSIVAITIIILGTIVMFLATKKWWGF